MDHLIFGMPDGSRSPQLEALLEACRPAGFQSTLSRDITVDIWTKFVRLSVFSGMTAVTRGPIGVIVNDPELLEMLKAAVRETLAVAHAKGVAVAEHDRRGRRGRLQGAAAAGEGVDARGSRARPPHRAAVAERRGRRASDARSASRRRSTRFITTVLKPYVNGALGLEAVRRDAALAVEAGQPRVVSAADFVRTDAWRLRVGAATIAIACAGPARGSSSVSSSIDDRHAVVLHHCRRRGRLGIRLERPRAGRSRAGRAVESSAFR